MPHRFLTALSFFYISLALVSCATNPMLVTESRVKIQSRIFEMKYEDAFRAFISLLQDEGYVIGEQDSAGGFIVALVPQSEKTKDMWEGVGRDGAFRKGEEYELSINLDRVPPASVRSRISVQKVEHLRLGGVGGRELSDRTAYDMFYKKLAVEVAKRTPLKPRDTQSKK